MAERLPVHARHDAVVLIGAGAEPAALERGVDFDGPPLTFVVIAGAEHWIPEAGLAREGGEVCHPDIVPQRNAADAPGEVDVGKPAEWPSTPTPPPPVPSPDGLSTRSGGLRKPFLCPFEMRTKPTR